MKQLIGICSSMLIRKYSVEAIQASSLFCHEFRKKNQNLGWICFEKKRYSDSKSFKALLKLRTILKLKSFVEALKLFWSLKALLSFLEDLENVRFKNLTAWSVFELLHKLQKAWTSIQKLFYESFSKNESLSQKA